NQPKDTVVRQDPAGGSSAAKGTTVTIFVSKGPKTSTVPDVQSYDKTTAGQTLHAAGFNVRVTWQDTTDPSQDGIVLSQDPEGGAETPPVPAQSGAMEALGAVAVAMPILHGPCGEDGTVQGVLELADVPYVGPGVLASALCMDKDVFKSVMRDNGIPVARHRTLRLGDSVENPFGYPVFVKPARLGSSVGISKVRSEVELEPAVALARRHDEKVLVAALV